jgi:hypothetical protein
MKTLGIIILLFLFFTHHYGDEKWISPSEKGIEWLYLVAIIPLLFLQ